VSLQQEAFCLLLPPRTARPKGREGKGNRGLEIKKKNCGEKQQLTKFSLINSGKIEIFLEEKLKYYPTVHTDILYEIHRHSQL
jgi:hypothetical protein